MKITSSLQIIDNYFTKTKNLLSTFSSDKKITFIALVVFAAIAIYYTVMYCFRASKEEAIHGTTPSSIGSLPNAKTPPRSLPVAVEYSDPLLSNYTQIDQKLISKLAETNADQHDILNTGMTELLINYTFADKLLPYDELNQFLKEIAAKAASEDNETARLALTRPNNHEQLSLTPALIHQGFPQNTPLLLLVKAGNLEGVKIILKAYQTEDLLFSTPRGNTALHLAILTGQIEIALALANRARELNCLDSLMEIKNKADQTAEKMYDSLIKELISKNKTPLFRPFLDFANPLLGGEEINKATIMKSNPIAASIRNSALLGIGKITSLTINESQKTSFIDIVKLDSGINLTAESFC